MGGPREHFGAMYATSNRRLSRTTGLLLLMRRVYFRVPVLVLVAVVFLGFWGSVASKTAGCHQENLGKKILRCARLSRFARELLYI